MDTELFDDFKSACLSLSSNISTLKNKKIEFKDAKTELFALFKSDSYLIKITYSLREEMIQLDIKTNSNDWIDLESIRYLLFGSQSHPADYKISSRAELRRKIETLVKWLPEAIEATIHDRYNITTLCNHFLDELTKEINHSEPENWDEITAQLSEKYHKLYLKQSAKSKNASEP